MRVSHVAAFLVGWFLSVPAFLYWQSRDAQPEPDCAQMSHQLWAFQQCLANQPACQIQGGQQAYADYHEMRDRFEVQCGADRGDTFLSQ